MKLSRTLLRSTVGISLALVLTLSSVGFASAMGGPAIPDRSKSVVSAACQDWSVLPSQNVGSYSNSLTGVAALSASDAWAVGSYTTSGDRNVPQTLIEHYDGSSWNVTSSPNPSAYDYVISVAAIASNNVWAVGSWNNPSTLKDQTLIERWDGGSWKVIPSANQANVGNVLLGVAAVSATDIWAVGYLYIGNYYPLIEHWDGSTWSIVQTPNPSGTDNVLWSVSAVSATDVWAVGSGGFGDRPLVEHWDGSAWSIVTVPYPAGQASVGFRSVTALSATNVWAVGSYADGTNASQHPLIEHWDGSAWTISSLPAQALPYAHLSAVAGLPGKLLAVGATAALQSGPYTALVLEWNGSTWNTAQAPTPNVEVTLDAAAVQGLNVFAVGLVGASAFGQVSTLATVHHPKMGIACA